MWIRAVRVPAGLQVRCPACGQKVTVTAATGFEESLRVVQGFRAEHAACRDGGPVAQGWMPRHGLEGAPPAAATA
jgi:hypothetical protein